MNRGPGGEPSQHKTEWGPLKEKRMVIKSPRSRTLQQIYKLSNIHSESLKEMLIDT